MNGREDVASIPTPKRSGLSWGKGTRYAVAQRNMSRSNPQRSTASRSGKRPTAEKDTDILKPPPKSYLKPHDSWRNVNLEDLKARHGLQNFEVIFYGDSDDITYDMIKNYKYDSTHLLTTVGQLESGLPLPLYKYNDTFYYDVLAFRDQVDGSAYRSVFQYNTNWYHHLYECRLR